MVATLFRNLQYNWWCKNIDPPLALQSAHTPVSIRLEARREKFKSRWIDAEVRKSESNQFPAVNSRPRPANAGSELWRASERARSLFHPLIGCVNTERGRALCMYRDGEHKAPMCFFSKKQTHNRARPAAGNIKKLLILLATWEWLVFFCVLQMGTEANQGDKTTLLTEGSEELDDWSFTREQKWEERRRKMFCIICVSLFRRLLILIPWKRKKHSKGGGQIEIPFLVIQKDIAGNFPSCDATVETFSKNRVKFSETG
jgi:hypothetical protein